MSNEGHKKNHLILAVIQARSGSKGIPNKNIFPLLGHPLMAYSIQAAKDATLVDHIVVSTDSETYADIAKSYGAEAPFLRPKELSGDKVTSADSLYHAVITTEAHKNVVYDYVVELPCVSPLRDGKDVDGAIQKLIKSGANSVISMSNTGEKHPIRLKRLVDDQILDFTKECPEPGGCSRRQDLLPASYIRNGAIYAMTRRLIVDQKTRHGTDSRPFIMEPERSINIDEKIDMVMAECLMRQGYCKNHPKKYKTASIEKVLTDKPHTLLVTAPLSFIPEIRAEIEQKANAIFAYGANRASIMEILPSIDAWICAPCPDYKIDADMLSAANRLKILATPSTGSNHIDVKWCHEHNLPISCLKDTDFVNTIYASSEFAWGLIMSVVRKIPKAVELVKQGHWRDVEETLRANEFHGKTIGIIGYGRIGSNIARYAHAFRMTINAFDPYKTITDSYVNQMDGFEKVLESSDIVLISVHLDNSTLGMVDAGWFRQMKKGVCFINISRGEIVNELDLLEALESKQVGSAGVDVISEELLSDKKNHPMIRYATNHDTLIITPHIAGLTRDSEYKAASFALNAVWEVLG